MFRRHARPSEAQQLRQKQIDSLRELVPSARAVVPDSSIWDVAVTSQQYGQLSFRITLPPAFPEQPPSMKLMVQGAHPWVAPDLTIVGVPRLAQWGVHTSLGAVALEVAEEFARNPPVPVGLSPAAAASAAPKPAAARPPAAAAGAAAAGAGAAGAAAGPEKPKAPTFEVPTAFDELDAYSSKQLEELLVNHEQFRDLLMRLECVQSARKVQDDLVADVEKVARANLDRKEEMEAARADLEAARATYSALRTEYDALSQRQQKVAQSYSVKAMLDALREAASEADTASEQLVDDFRDGTTEAATFVRDYQRARVRYHERAAKRERLQYQIRH